MNCLSIILSSSVTLGEMSNDPPQFDPTSIQNIAAVSSDEEEDLNQLQSVEQKLPTHDQNFTSQHTHASLISQRSPLLSAFRPIYPEGDFAGASRIHLDVERWRVCESWFCPAMVGRSFAECVGSFTRTREGPVGWGMLPYFQSA